jgi:hypothetical protein
MQSPADSAPDPVLLARGRAVEPWDAGVPPQDASLPEDPSDAALGGELDAGPKPAGPPSRIVFRFTTRSQGGRYQPKNVGAIWVEDGTGGGIKILALWASLRVRYLSEYLASNPQRDLADAVTSATLRDHQTHEVSWNLRGKDGQVLPDGAYSLVAEVTDRDGTGQTLSVMFQKGLDPQQMRPADTEFYSDIELLYE